MLDIFSKDSQNRARKGDFLGHVLVGILITIFASMFAINTYQFDFWQQYFFNDSIPVSKCQVAWQIVGTDTPRDNLKLDQSKLKNTAMPHSLSSPVKGKLSGGERADVYYRCDISLKDFSKTEGIINMHMGWIYGDQIAIQVNETDRAYSESTGKFVVPLSESDFKASSLKVEVLLSSDTRTYLGFAGKAPFVITEGLQKNNKLFGIESSLQQTRYLFMLMPVLTMSFILFLGWMSGVRSRFMVVTFFYFVMMSFLNLIPYIDYLTPWRSDVSYALRAPFYLGSYLGFAAFGMELLGLWRRRVSALMYITTFIVSVLVITIALIESPTGFTVMLGKVNIGAIITISMLLLAFGSKQLNTENLEPARLRVNKIFLGAVGVVLLLSLIDLYLKSIASPVRLSRKMDIIMPYFIGGILLYTLSLIDRSYRREKEHREKMERDLDLAREIQDSLAPPPARNQVRRDECLVLSDQTLTGCWRLDGGATLR